MEFVDRVYAFLRTFMQQYQIEFILTFEIQILSWGKIQKIYEILDESTESLNQMFLGNASS
jgi:hypothetical protein